MIIYITMMIIGGVIGPAVVTVINTMQIGIEGINVIGDNYKRHHPGKIHYRSRGAAVDTGTVGNPYGFPSAYVKVYNSESGTNEMIWHRRVNVHDTNCQNFEVYDGPLYNAQHWRKCFQTVDVIIEPPQAQTTLKLLIGVNLVEDQWDRQQRLLGF